MNELVLSLKNFQSITEGELVFKTGLNFIIGQSNSGKSATFRALKACLINPSGSQRFIKKGTNDSVVTLKYNGNVIEWERTFKESNYVINGEEYVKTGRSNAFKILNDDIGFVKDDDNGIMNIEEELQLPFPFGMSGSDLFKLFENVFCVSDSAVILKSAKEYEKGVEAEISSLDFEKQKVQVKIRELNDFKEFLDLGTLTSHKEWLESKTTRLELLKDGLSTVKKALKLEERGLEVGEVNFADLFSPYLSALECKKALVEVKKLHNLHKSLQELKYESESKYEPYKLLKLLKNLSSVKIKEHEFPSLLEEYALLKQVRDCNLVKMKLVNFENKLQELNRLKEVKKIISSTKLQIKQLRTQGEQENEKLREATEKLKEFKVCPLCHHELS